MPWVTASRLIFGASALSRMSCLMRVGDGQDFEDAGAAEVAGAAALEAPLAALDLDPLARWHREHQRS